MTMTGDDTLWVKGDVLLVKCDEAGKAQDAADDDIPTLVIQLKE
jgi:hypothetical protein